MKTKLTIALAALVAISAFAAVRPPQPSDKDIISLAWDYEQGDTPAVNFKIYYGKSPGNYSAVVATAGLEQTAQVEITEGGTYYFTATAVGSNGLESLPSTEISHTIVPRPLSPSNLTGTRITILVD